MKTARRTIRRSLPARELDKLILQLISRGVGAPSSDSDFNCLALLLFRHQFDRNLAYRRYCDLLGISASQVNHWSQIPAVPTTAFKDTDLTTLPPKQRRYVFHSSGTTGQRPSRHFHDVATRALYEAALWTAFEKAVLGLSREAVRSRRRKEADGSPVAPCPPPHVGGYNGNNLLILTPTPAEAPHSSLVHMMETVRRRLNAPSSAFIGARVLENERTLAAAVQSKIHNPTPKAFGVESTILLLGTAFAFVRLLDAVESLPLPIGSRVMETGGYKGRSREVPRDELHDLMATKFSISRSAIVSEYGMCELSSQFYSTLRTPHSAFFSGPPWTRVQMIDPENGREVREGKRGLIRIFDLANRGSVIAIQTEDVGVKHGDGFELIGRAPQAEARGCSLMVPA